jgi:hypothetical protein
VTSEVYAIGVFKRLFVRKICRPTKREENWCVITSKEVQGVLQRGFVQFIKSLRLRLYGHIEKINNERMPK